MGSLLTRNNLLPHSDAARISKHYMHGWFFIDFLAVLPVSYVALLVSSAADACAGVGASTRLFKVLRLIRLAHLLRLAKLREVVRMMVSDIDALEDSFKYVKIFVAMVRTKSLPTTT